MQLDKLLSSHNNLDGGRRKKWLCADSVIPGFFVMRVINSKSIFGVKKSNK